MHRALRLDQVEALVGLAITNVIFPNRPLSANREHSVESCSTTKSSHSKWRVGGLSLPPLLEVTTP